MSTSLQTPETPSPARPTPEPLRPETLSPIETIRAMLDASPDGATFTLDARTPDGAYGEDHGLTADQIRAALTNAPRLGIELLHAYRDDEPVNPAMLTAAAWAAGVNL